MVTLTHIRPTPGAYPDHTPHTRPPHPSYPQDAHNQCRQALAVKGALERAQLVQHAAQRPHVALTVVRPVLANLGRQVVRRADLQCRIIEWVGGS